MAEFHDYSLDELQRRGIVVRPREAYPLPTPQHQAAPAPSQYDPYQDQPTQQVNFPAQVPEVLPPAQVPTVPTNPERKNNNMRILAIGAAVVLAVGVWKANTGADTTPESASIGTHGKTGGHGKPGGKTGATSSASESTSPSTDPSTTTESTSPSDTASSMSTASSSASPAALVPFPANGQLGAPACIDYKVQFMNNKDGQTAFPTSWNFLSKDSGPYIVAGKMSGPMALQACLDSSAIKYDKDASDRTGQSVITVDVSKATITPSYDPNKLHNGISFAKKVDNDAKLLAALKVTNPAATDADVANLHTLWDANTSKIQQLNLLTSFDWLKYYYQKPILDDEYSSFREDLMQQLQDKGYTANIVPDIAAPKSIAFNIKQVPKQDLAGPFDYLAAPATINAGILNTETGKQLVPEQQP